MRGHVIWDLGSVLTISATPGQLRPQYKQMQTLSVLRFYGLSFLTFKYICCGTPFSWLVAAPVWRLPGLGIQKNPLPAAELLDQHISWTDHFNDGVFHVCTYFRIMLLDMFAMYTWCLCMPFWRSYIVDSADYVVWSCLLYEIKMDAGCCSQKALSRSTALFSIPGLRAPNSTWHQLMGTHQEQTPGELQNCTAVQNISLAERQVWKQFAPGKKHGE